ncbi:hypothetical protein [Defluviitalea phaphyphila]|uniref:hypothetical protein n=1 Tax=Defluviitalea phaphyphila TaxID=1473580 RepID=UPI00072FE03B|nr:hypothetical protein [Defluviitalea phaphyphila]
MWKIFYIMYMFNKFKNKNLHKSKFRLINEPKNKIILKNVLEKYIGQTITIFLKSGGYSGSGYTGILINVNREYISIYINPFCIVEIPISQIICFSHNIN